MIVTLRDRWSGGFEPRDTSERVYFEGPFFLLAQQHYCTLFLQRCRRSLHRYDTRYRYPYGSCTGSLLFSTARRFSISIASLPYLEWFCPDFLPNSQQRGVTGLYQICTCSSTENCYVSYRSLLVSYLFSCFFFFSLYCVKEEHAGATVRTTARRAFLTRYMHE